MESESKVIARQEGAIAHLLLNKPRKLNALDEEMLAELERRMAEWEAGGEVSVVVIGSTSARAFCVGADLEVLSRLDSTTMQAWELNGSRVLDRIQHSPLVTVAVIAGHALGGGLTLAAACDFRIASGSAGFAQPEIELGWIPGWVGVARLARLIGPGRAKELCATGRRISAAEAARIGLVDAVHPPDALEAASEEFVQMLASRGPQALRAIKVLAEQAAGSTPATAHRFDALVNATLLNDPRGQAAIAAFLAKTRK
jgi:enoyl-CoA hydratase/carnithine racemase